MKQVQRRERIVSVFTGPGNRREKYEASQAKRIKNPNAGMTIRRPSGHTYTILGSARRMLEDRDVTNVESRWKRLWMVVQTESATAIPVLKETRWIQQCELVAPGQHTGRKTKT